MLETVLSAAVCTVAGNEALSKGNVKPQEITDGNTLFYTVNNSFLTGSGRNQGSQRHTRRNTGNKENSVLLTGFQGTL